MMPVMDGDDESTRRLLLLALDMIRDMHEDVKALKNAQNLVPQPPQHETHQYQTEISKLKKNITTYYPRCHKETSSEDVRRTNQAKVNAWINEIREYGVDVKEYPQQKRIVFQDI